MGFYLNVPGKENATEQWLHSKGYVISTDDAKNHVYENSENVIICLIDNIQFTTAAILYDKQEAERFLRPDKRFKVFYLVQLKDLQTIISAKTLAIYGLTVK